VRNYTISFNDPFLIGSLYDGNTMIFCLIPSVQSEAKQEDSPFPRTLQSKDGHSSVTRRLEQPGGILKNDSPTSRFSFLHLQPSHTPSFERTSGKSRFSCFPWIILDVQMMRLATFSAQLFYIAF